MNTDHWSKRTVDFLASRVKGAQELVRVATGFFTIEGYDLLRPYLKDVALHLMVGYDEASRERLRAHLIENVMLHLRLWDAANRRAAVLDLATRLEAGELRIVEQGGSWAIYDVRFDRLETYREDKLLDLLQCSQDMPVAAVDPDEIETLAQRCRALWMEQNRIDSTEAIERICALYLEPFQDQAEMDLMLRRKL